jgi:predicted LPLAT superfamily acyltransferase
MAKWRGQSKGNRLGYRIFVGLLQHAGVRPAYFLLYFVAAYYWLFAWQSSRHMYAYFTQKLGWGPLKAIFALYRNYYVFGQTLIDRIVVMSGVDNNFTFDFDGEDNLRQMVRNGKGGMLISAHLGNWEIAGHLLKRLEAKVNIVMYEGEKEKLKQYLDQVKGPFSFNIIGIGNDLSHIYAIADALKRNELVCMHADRFTEGSRSIEAAFLGDEARFPLGPFAISTKLRAPVSYVFAFKESATHYHFFSSPICEYGNARTEMDRMLNDYIGELHVKVRQYPLQWFNYYDFWSKEA